MTTRRRGRKKKLNRKPDDRVHVFVPFVCAKCGSLDIEIQQNVAVHRQQIVGNILNREFVIGIPEEDVDPFASVRCLKCGSKKALRVFSYVRARKESVDEMSLKDQLERLASKYDVHDSSGKKRVEVKTEDDNSVRSELIKFVKGEKVPEKKSRKRKSKKKVTYFYHDVD